MYFVHFAKWTLQNRPLFGHFKNFSYLCSEIRNVFMFFINYRLRCETKTIGVKSVIVYKKCHVVKRGIFFVMFFYSIFSKV
jgi:hypothetical protein